MDSKERSLGLKDLLNRINNTEAEANQEIGDQDDTRTEWRNADRRRGFERYEVLFKVKSLVSLFRKIFEKEKR